MTRRLLRAVCAMLCLTSVAASAGEQPASGTVRVWTSGAMKGILARWQDGFRKSHPGMRIVATTTGSDVAMAGLYTDRADVALMGREPTASEVQAFEWIYRVKPTRVEVMSGSLAAPEKSPAVVVLVHRDNPLSKLTLAQLDAIFSYEHLRGPKAIRTWGDLGLGGDWATRPIALYGPDITSGTGTFFRHAVLNDSRKLDWERMHEFVDRKNPDGTVSSAGEQIAEALAHDRFGIGVTQLGLDRSQLKPLALASDEAGPFVEPTAANVAARKYPLARTVVALVKRVPGHPVDPAVDAFLRYLLSEEGQAEVARDGFYFPLSVDVARKQLVTLE